MKVKVAELEVSESTTVIAMFLLVSHGTSCLHTLSRTSGSARPSPFAAHHATTNTSAQNMPPTRRLHRHDRTPRTRHALLWLDSLHNTLQDTYTPHCPYTTLVGFFRVSDVPLKLVITTPCPIMKASRTVEMCPRWRRLVLLSPTRWQRLNASNTDINLVHRSAKVDPEEAKRESLVPRVDFDVEHHKMREAYVCNLNGKVHMCT